MKIQVETDSGYRVFIDSQKDSINVNGESFPLGMFRWFADAACEGKIYKYSRNEDGQIVIHDLTRLIDTHK